MAAALPDESLMQSDVLIKLEHLSVSYGRQLVFADVDMAVREGEFWFLLGPNGTGKSTLIKVLLGVVQPRGGQVGLHASLADRQALGFVPQRISHAASLPMTVREFVALGLVQLDLPRAQRQLRVEQALGQVSLLDRQQASFQALSGGQQQRAMVARAMVRQPRLLIVDEPTNGLDPVAEHDLLDLLAELNARTGMTLLFVTHDLATAARFGSHAALFHHGQVRAGLIDQVLTPQHLAACYGMPLRLDRHDRVVTVSLDRQPHPRERQQRSATGNGERTGENQGERENPSSRGEAG